MGCQAREIYDRWRKARAAAWTELLAGLTDEERADVRDDMVLSRKRQRRKAREAVERMRVIVSAYGMGMTAEEIGELVGVCGKEVRQFAARRGVRISRGDHRYRKVRFAAAEEASLRRLAEDRGETPMQTLQALTKAALEYDAHPARRILGVNRRRPDEWRGEMRLVAAE